MWTGSPCPASRTAASRDFSTNYALIEQRTGLAFRFVQLGDGLDFQQVLDALRARRIDMIDGTGKTADRATYALFAGPFWEFPLGLVSRDDGVVYSRETLSGKVAVARGSTAEEFPRERAPGLDLVETADPVAALSLVATYKADAAVEKHGRGCLRHPQDRLGQRQDFRIARLQVQDILPGAQRLAAARLHFG